MKAAIYARVSRADLNIENQIMPLKEYAEKMGWEYHVFAESESTRKTRPVQQEVLHALMRREFDGLLVWKLDRWARSMVELVNHMNIFLDKGIIFVSLKDNIDLGTATGRLYFGILSAMAEFERELIRERTIAGLERAKAQGKKLGRPWWKVKAKKINGGCITGG